MTQIIASDRDDLGAKHPKGWLYGIGFKARTHRYFNLSSVQILCGRWNRFP
jgi:hypothetical protein